MLATNEAAGKSCTRPVFSQRESDPVAVRAIISYDDTQNDHDGLMLGAILADAGAKLTLAYVRHSTQASQDGELIAGHEADAVLESGARWLDDPYVERRVVVSPSTGEGLAWLARREEAE